MSKNFGKYDEVARHLRLDANETAFAVEQLNEVESTVYETVYADLLSSQLIPLDTGVNTGAETTSFDRIDKAGSAAIEDGYSNTAPLLDISRTRTAKRIYPIRLGYQWSIQDVRAAAMAGVPLQAERTMAVRAEVERKVDEVCALGHSELGIDGFFSHSEAASPLTAGNGSWVYGTTTADEIVEDLTQLVSDIVVDNLNTLSMMPDTLVLPVAQWDIAMQTYRANTDTTALQLMLRNNPYIQSIVPWHYGATADAAGTGPRAVAYKRDPRVLQKVVPQPFELLAPFQKSSTIWEQEGHMRTAGVKLRYPAAFRYMDGL